jgi:GIY-YIG catalytic domain
MTPASVARTLTTCRRLTVAEAEERSRLPRGAGVYAWWQDPGALPGVSAPVHPTADLELLYVGIAPRDASSRATLASRLRRQHIGGNIGSSTFRFGLAALLWERQGWQPLVTAGGKYRLSRARIGRPIGVLVPGSSNTTLREKIGLDHGRAPEGLRGRPRGTRSNTRPLS